MIIFLLACSLGNSHIVRRLIEAPGIDFNLRPIGVLSPASMAVVNGHVKVVEILTKSAIDWNYKDSMGETVVFACIKYRRFDCLKLLMSVESVDWNISNCSGKTPLMILVEKENKNTLYLELLRQVPSIDWNYINKFQSEHLNCDDSVVTLTLNKENQKFFHYLLSLPEIKIDIEHLKKKCVHRKAVLESIKYVKHMMIHDGNNPDINATNVYPYLIFALRKNLTEAVISLLVSYMSLWDIVDLVNYRKSTLASPSLTSSNELKRAIAASADDNDRHDWKKSRKS